MEVSSINIIQALAALISSLLAGTALLYSMFAYTRNLKVSHYNELDRIYQSLLTLAFHSTYLTQPETITTKEQQEKYDIYAFMVWNFLESIYDKCLKDEHLRDTWVPIIEVEGILHNKWFKREENMPKFKPQFSNFIEKLLGHSAERANLW